MSENSTGSSADRDPERDSTVPSMNKQMGTRISFISSATNLSLVRLYHKEVSIPSNVLLSQSLKMLRWNGLSSVGEKK
jgi:hypothetical protein